MTFFLFRKSSKANSKNVLASLDTFKLRIFFNLRPKCYINVLFIILSHQIISSYNTFLTFDFENLKSSSVYDSALCICIAHIIRKVHGNCSCRLIFLAFLWPISQFYSGNMALKFRTSSTNPDMKHKSEKWMMILLGFTIFVGLTALWTLGKVSQRGSLRCCLSKRSLSNATLTMSSEM